MVLGGITYHYLVKVLRRSATSKGADLSCELDYAISFWSWILSCKYTHFVEISTFRGYYLIFVEISTFRGYYPRAYCRSWPRHQYQIQYTVYSTVLSTVVPYYPLYQLGPKFLQETYSLETDLVVVINPYQYVKWVFKILPLLLPPLQFIFHQYTMQLPPYITLLQPGCICHYIIWPYGHYQHTQPLQTYQASLFLCFSIYFLSHGSQIFILLIQSRNIVFAIKIQEGKREMCRFVGYTFVVMLSHWKTE